MHGLWVQAPSQALQSLFGSLSLSLSLCPSPIHTCAFSLKINKLKKIIKKVKYNFTYDPAIPLSGIYSKEMKTYGYTKDWYMNVLSSATHNSQKPRNDANIHQLMTRQNVVLSIQFSNTIAILILHSN